MMGVRIRMLGVTSMARPTTTTMSISTIIRRVGLSTRPSRPAVSSWGMRETVM